MKATVIYSIVTLTLMNVFGLSGLAAGSETQQAELAAMRLVHSHFRATELADDVAKLKDLTSRLDDREPLRVAPERFSKNLLDIKLVTAKALGGLEELDRLQSSEVSVKSSQAGILSILAALKLRLTQLDRLNPEDKQTLESMITSVQALTSPVSCEIEG